MREAEQIKRFRSRLLEIVISTKLRRPTERNDAGLLWVKAQPVLLESLRQYGQHPVSVFLALEDDDEIIRVSDQGRTSSEARLDLILEPLVEDFVQVDVRQ